MFYSIRLDQKSRQFLIFPRSDFAKYFYKMAATAGPSCGEQGPKFSKQELSCFSGVHHEIIGWDCGNANIFRHTQKNLK